MNIHFNSFYTKNIGHKFCIILFAFTEKKLPFRYLSVIIIEKELNEKYHERMTKES